MFIFSPFLKELKIIKEITVLHNNTIIEKIMFDKSVAENVPINNFIIVRFSFVVSYDKIWPSVTRPCVDSAVILYEN